MTKSKFEEILARTDKMAMQFLLNNLMELNESYRKSVIPYGKVH
jgi:hypothetical protein